MLAKRFETIDVVLVCGLPASGKTKLTIDHFSGSGRNRLNRGEIRKMVYEMTNFHEPYNAAKFKEDDEPLVKHLETKVLQHYLELGRSIIIDNTSISRRSRAAYLEMIKKYRKSMGVIFMATPVDLCLERNRTADYPVPERLISLLSAELEIPKKEEGYQDLVLIHPPSKQS